TSPKPRYWHKKKFELAEWLNGIVNNRHADNISTCATPQQQSHLKQQSSLAALRRHAGYIQDLTVLSDLTSFPRDNFLSTKSAPTSSTSIEFLSICDHSRASQEQKWQRDVRAFLGNNDNDGDLTPSGGGGGLRRLVISGLNPTGVLACLNLVTECCGSTLKEVRLESVVLDLSSLILLRDRSSSLSHITLNYCKIPSGHILEGPLFPTIEAFEFHDDYCFDEFLPNLCLWGSLGPLQPRFDPVEKTFISAPPTTHGPRVSKLILNSCTCNRPASLAMILANFPILKDLTLKGSFFRHPLNFTALVSTQPLMIATRGSILERLTRLDLMYCAGVESWMCKRIFATCPGLVSFACPSFDVDEIFGDVSGPDIGDGFNSNTFYSNHWACVDSLRNLTIGQFAWSSHVGRSERAKERLGSLKFLEDLTLGKVVIRAGEIASWRWPQ
ncbi:hypothetical protein BGX26_004087, partial [Mortierella sp. AD094]